MTATLYQPLRPELYAATFIVMLSQWGLGKFIEKNHPSALKALFSQILAITISLWIFTELWHFLFAAVPTTLEPNGLLSNTLCHQKSPPQACCEAAASQLGVDSNTSPAAIKAIIRQRLFETHPDRFKDTRSESQNTLNAKNILLNCQQGFKP